MLTVDNEGEVLQKWLENKGWKAPKLAAELGVQPETIYYHLGRKKIADSFKHKLSNKNIDVFSSKKDDKSQTIAKPTDTNGNKSNVVQVVDYEHNLMIVPLVPIYAYAGYQNGYADPEYMKTLPTEPFPADREYKGTYICFEVKGDSLDDDTKRSICAGDKVLGRELTRDRWRDKLHIHKYLFVVVTRNEGIVIKQIIKHDTEKGIITLHSYNMMYDDYDIKLDDVAQLFNVVAYKREM